MPHTRYTNTFSHEGIATGFPQSLFSIDQVLDGSDDPEIFTTHDEEHRYLVVEVRREEHRRVWIFAPLSDRALECTLSGRADLRDVFLHTVTGTVDVLTATDDGEVTESVQLCDSLTEDVLPSPGRHLAA
jgi:hypothetical protein